MGLDGMACARLTRAIAAQVCRISRVFGFMVVASGVVVLLSGSQRGILGPSGCPPPGVRRLMPPRLGGQWPNAGPHAQLCAPSPERLHAPPPRPLHGPLGP